MLTYTNKEKIKILKEALENHIKVKLVFKYSTGQHIIRRGFVKSVSHDSFDFTDIWQEKETEFSFAVNNLETIKDIGEDNETQ